MNAHRWKPVEPMQAAAWFRSVSVPWWVAGGWAVDLFIERVSREHEDLDIGVFRRDLPVVAGALPGWQIFEAKDGALTELGTGAPPRSDVHSLWCRRNVSSPWELEIMLESSSGPEWVYRRDSRVRRQLPTVFRLSSCGLRYLAPEVQLLFKSKGTRPRDNTDLRNALPRLNRDERAWLKNALRITDPKHAWHESIDHEPANNELERARDG
jgi:hypothetical protein